MINWKKFYMDTFLPDFPKMLNDNNQVFENYIDVFYDGSLGILIAPLQTTGNVRGANATFVNGVFDNLTVRRQFTNLYENTTTADADYYNTYIGGDASTRDPSVGGWYDTSLGYGWDSSVFRYIDVQKPYYKIANCASIAFTVEQLSQEFQILFDSSLTCTTSPFRIMLDPSKGAGALGIEIMEVVQQDASMAWVKLLAVGWDASLGTTWNIKQYGGSYTIYEI